MYVLLALPKIIRSKISIDPKTGCWNWKGNINGTGYGRVWIKGQRQMAHRVVYRLLKGNIGNKQLDHICCNRKCVNPNHLQPVTAKENCRRRNYRMRNRK